MIFFYELITSLLLLLSPLVFIFRIFKKKEHIIRFKEKLCFFSKSRKKGKIIWFHCCSVGELRSVMPIINKFESRSEIKQILVTTSTLSSSLVFEQQNLKKTIHQFFPIDNFLLTKNFVNYWKPNVAIFVESEIWPSMFYRLKKKNIPLILLNARITKKTYKRWRNINIFSKNIFNKIDLALPQNHETKTDPFVFVGGP